MSDMLFDKILDIFLPYLDHLEMLTLTGIGEPLLDKNVSNKIAKAKKLGFRGVAVYTNATPLTAKTSSKLLDSGLDTLVISLDGITAETQDVIREGSNIKKVLLNIHKFIKLRNNSNSKTKLILRFTRQKINEFHFDDYKEYWKKYLNFGIGDQILRYDVHNRSDLIDTSSLNIKSNDARPPNMKCDELFKRITVLSSGDLRLCCGDHHDKYKIGSLLDTSPIELYNSGYHKQFRERMMNGKFSELDICQICSVINSFASKNSFNG